MDHKLLCKMVFELYPFGVIFSKKAPQDLKNLNFNSDFCYFYFSPGLEKLCLLKRKNLCDGKTNAKQDFPDYKSYFEDDCSVMAHYTSGKVLSFSEPWAPPGIQSYIYTRKTALMSENIPYMLGTFDLVNHVTLGIAKFKRIPHNTLAALPFLENIPNSWFCDAFEAFPNGIAVLQTDNTVVCINTQWKAQESFSSINQKFKEHGFEAKDLLTSAAWITNVITNSEGQRCDVGTYGIQVENAILQVLLLRPTMSNVSTPRWEAKFIEINH